MLEQPPMDDELLQQIRRERIPARHPLYRRYFRRAFALAYRMLADAPAAEACVQAVFLHVWQQPAHYDGRRAAVALRLLTAAHARARRQLGRQQCPPPPSVLICLPDADPHPDESGPAAGSSVRDELDGTTLCSRRIQSAWSTLAAPQRALGSGLLPGLDPARKCSRSGVAAPHGPGTVVHSRGRVARGARRRREGIAGRATLRARREAGHQAGAAVGVGWRQK